MILTESARRAVRVGHRVAEEPEPAAHAHLAVREDIEVDAVVGEERGHVRVEAFSPAPKRPGEAIYVNHNITLAVFGNEKVHFHSTKKTISIHSQYTFYFINIFLTVVLN